MEGGCWQYNAIQGSNAPCTATDASRMAASSIQGRYVARRSAILLALVAGLLAGGWVVGKQSGPWGARSVREERDKDRLNGQ